MKKILFSAIFCICAFSQVVNVSDFRADVYSKAGANLSKKISLSLEVIGRDVDENEAYILDALNIVIGSFYVEDLLTSLGKEKFKETLIKYANKKHSVDIDEILIMSLKIVQSSDIDEIIAAIKARNLCDCKDSKTESKQEQSLKQNLKPIDLGKIVDFGKDFE